MQCPCGSETADRIKQIKLKQYEYVYCPKCGRTYIPEYTKQQLTEDDRLDYFAATSAQSY